jgi:hypothetical protein
MSLGITYRVLRNLAAASTGGTMNHIEKIHSSTLQRLRMRAAAEQAAMHSVKLAVARWTCADVEFELAASLPSTHRSRWHAVAQNDFMAWLNAGGFAQADLDVCGLPVVDLALASGPSAIVPTASYSCPL